MYHYHYIYHGIRLLMWASHQSAFQSARGEPCITAAATQGRAVSWLWELYEIAKKTGKRLEDGEAQFRSCNCSILSLLRVYSAILSVQCCSARCQAWNLAMNAQSCRSTESTYDVAVVVIWHRWQGSFGSRNTQTSCGQIVWRNGEVMRSQEVTKERWRALKEERDRGIWWNDCQLKSLVSSHKTEFSHVWCAPKCGIQWQPMQAWGSQHLFLLGMSMSMN